MDYAPPISEADALHALERAIPHAHEFVMSGQLEIISCSQWYFLDEIIQAGRILEAWPSKMSQAARCFAGLRVAGDTSWLQSQEQARAIH